MHLSFNKPRYSICDCLKSEKIIILNMKKTSTVSQFTRRGAGLKFLSDMFMAEASKLFWRLYSAVLVLLSHFDENVVFIMFLLQLQLQFSNNGGHILRKLSLK